MMWDFLILKQSLGKENQCVTSRLTHSQVVRGRNFVRTIQHRKTQPLTHARTHAHTHTRQRQQSHSITSHVCLTLIMSNTLQSTTRQANSSKWVNKTPIEPNRALHPRARFTPGCGYSYRLVWLWLTYFCTTQLQLQCTAVLVLTKMRVCFADTLPSVKKT